MEQWVNGGFFFCEPRVLGLPRAGLGRSSASRSSGWPPTGELRGFRHEGFWDCMDTYKDAVVLNDLWATGSPPWRIWEAAAAPVGRPDERALVTGGRGFVGAWLCRALVERGVEVACFDRRGPHERPSTLAMLGLDADGGEREGELVDGAILRSGAAVTARSTPSSTSPPRRSSAPSRPIPAAASRPTCAAPGPLLEACRARGVERVVVASSDKAYGAHEELPYREDFALRPTAPYEASKAAADLIARSYWPSLRAAGGGDPLRQHLRRRRPQLLAPGPRGGLRGDRRAARRCSAPTARRVRDLLYVEDAADAYLAIADRLDRDDVRGEAFNAGGERPYSVLEIVEAVAPARRHRGRAGVPRRRQPGRGDRPPVRRRDEDRASAAVGGRGRPRGGPRADDRLVPGSSRRPALRRLERGRPWRPTARSSFAYRRATDSGRELGERGPPQALAVPAPRADRLDRRGDVLRGRVDDRLADVDPEPLADLAQGGPEADDRRPGRERLDRSPGRTTRCARAGRGARRSASPRSTAFTCLRGWTKGAKVTRVPEAELATSGRAAPPRAARAPAWSPRPPACAAAARSRAPRVLALVEGADEGDARRVRPRRRRWALRECRLQRVGDDQRPLRVAQAEARRPPVARVCSDGKTTAATLSSPGLGRRMKRSLPLARPSSGSRATHGRRRRSAPPARPVPARARSGRR